MIYVLIGLDMSLLSDLRIDCLVIYVLIGLDIRLLSDLRTDICVHCGSLGQELGQWTFCW